MGLLGVWGLLTRALNCISCTCIWLKLLSSSTCTNIFFTLTFMFICTIGSHCFLYLHIFFSSFSCRSLHTACTYMYIKELTTFYVWQENKKSSTDQKKIYVHYRHIFVQNFSYMWRQRFAFCALAKVNRIVGRG